MGSKGTVYVNFRDPGFKGEQWICPIYNSNLETLICKNVFSFKKMINSHNFSIVSEARIAQVFFIVKQQFEQTKLSMVPL